MPRTRRGRPRLGVVLLQRGKRRSISVNGDFSAFVRALVPNERIMRISGLKFDASTISSNLKTMGPWPSVPDQEVFPRDMSNGSFLEQISSVTGGLSCLKVTGPKVPCCHKVEKDYLLIEF